MANSFALDSQSYQGRHLRLTCNQIPSIASNLSTVEWTLAATGGSSSYYTTGPTTVKINGKIVYYKAKTAWTSHEFPAAKGSVSGVATVPHDELGNAVIEVSIRTNIYTGVLQTKTGTWELDPITRFADLTTAAGFTDDENPTISYSNMREIWLMALRLQSLWTVRHLWLSTDLFRQIQRNTLSSSQM